MNKQSKGEKAVYAPHTLRSGSKTKGDKVVKVKVPK